MEISKALWINGLGIVAAGSIGALLNTKRPILGFGRGVVEGAAVIAVEYSFGLKGVLVYGIIRGAIAVIEVSRNFFQDWDNQITQNETDSRRIIREERLRQIAGETPRADSQGNPPIPFWKRWLNNEA